MSTPSADRPPPRLLRRLLRGAERALAGVGALLLLYHAGFGVTEVVSDSMGPALVGRGPGAAGNDWVLVERIRDRFTTPERFDVIQFRSDEGVTILKRVVAFPGERVRVATEGGGLEVDGRRFAAPAGSGGYLRAGRLRPRADEAPYTVEGGLFVLGDRSQDSWDSRFWGEVEPERRGGRVLAVVWPPHRWRWVGGADDEQDDEEKTP